MDEQNEDVTIYVQVVGSTYNLRYELQKQISPAIVRSIDARLLKSFSLGRSFADAYTQPGIDQKAQLMKNIFFHDYGLTAKVIKPEIG